MDLGSKFAVALTEVSPHTLSVGSYGNFRTAVKGIALQHDKVSDVMDKNVGTHKIAFVSVTIEDGYGHGKVGAPVGR